MFFNNQTFIGIDPTAGDKPLVYAAIDHQKRLLALGEGSLDEVLAFAGGQKEAVVAICGPRRPNMGLLKHPEVREKLTPPPAPGRWVNFRVVEYQLRLHNIYIPPTLDEPVKCPRWMQQSFVLFSRLMKLGYQLYPAADSAHLCTEVYPHAAYAILLGHLPFHKTTLEGRLQRQLVLFEHELKVSDPMVFFEEITRFRLLKGVLPLDHIFVSTELDALVGAYCAWLTANQPNQVLLLGDPDEGQILLPTADLKTRYPQVASNAPTAPQIER